MANQNIARHEGNWTELRRLVLRLLEEHEDSIECLEKVVSDLKERYAVSASDLDGLRKYVFQDGGLWTAVKLLQQQIDQVKEAQTEPAPRLPLSETLTKKALVGLVVAGLGALSGLAIAIGKLVELLGNKV